VAQYLDFLKTQLNEADQIAGSYYRRVTGTTKPGDNNQVLTDADLAIGKHLVDAVTRAYPDHNIIDEEAGVVDRGSDYTWVIDPIEGTSNFAAGLPQYGIMIGLLHHGTPIAGGITAPAMGMLYLAEQGKGTTCNGEPIHATADTNLSHYLISYGLDGNRDDPEQTRREGRLIAELALKVRNIRNSGCEALDTMYVAEGRYGARVNGTAKIWDVVGPSIILVEAGATVTDLAGQPMDFSDPLSKAKQNFTQLFAAPGLHQALLEIITHTN
jgi:myo-inositol-1(or 4)-monophosphatase